MVAAMEGFLDRSPISAIVAVSALALQPFPLYTPGHDHFSLEFISKSDYTRGYLLTAMGDPP
jgi:hypothetical protein